MNKGSNVKVISDGTLGETVVTCDDILIKPVQSVDYHIALNELLEALQESTEIVVTLKQEEREKEDAKEEERRSKGRTKI